ncbi:MAG: FAD-dependent oxidoreductase [Bacteriovoracaceae bacterium]|nr:FAD-dependent oxidoreductase [Bacteriovoracaceae bacterium]
MKKVIIVGAGTGGITVTARLINELNNEVEVTLVAPATSHFYQPLWTLVGAGVTTHEETEKSMKSVFPEGVKWIQQKVVTFNPEQNLITLDNNSSLSYDILIVAAGMQLDSHKIQGAIGALEYDNVCANYKTYGSTKTWKVLQNTTEENAVFTQPPMPIKCGGGPQKAVYLADDYFRQSWPPYFWH